MNYFDYFLTEEIKASIGKRKQKTWVHVSDSIGIDSHKTCTPFFELNRL
jgi:hypothetical protein